MMYIMYSVKWDLWTGDVVETSKIETRLGGHGLTRRNPASNQC